MTVFSTIHDSQTFIVPNFNDTKLEKAVSMPQNESKRKFPYDVFISYSSKNKAVTNALCHYLEGNKIRCWMAPRDILPGKEYGDVIEQAIHETRVFILVFSKKSLNSIWVRKETNLAVSDEKIIIPFRIEDCVPTGAMRINLNDVHWIDAITEPVQPFGNLAAAIFAKGKISRQKMGADRNLPHFHIFPHAQVRYKNKTLLINKHLQKEP